MIGLGYPGTLTPPVILRNVLENPAWYTAYTPYQPEISQGRLEALLNFQTMVADLTGLAMANASLLDEATAAAEAMTLARRSARRRPARVVPRRRRLPPADDRRRAHPGRAARPRRRGGRPGRAACPRATSSACCCSTRARRARCATSRRVVAAGRTRAAPLVAVAADLLALTLLASPGELGADVAVGTSQRFGVPLGYGGPHAGYMAVRAGLERTLPGRLVGVSVDADGAPGLPAGAADPRAAHPPGEGDQQHLHRAGAARRDGRDVRRLPRPRRAARHRAAHRTGTPPLLAAGLAAAASRSCTRTSSTPSGARARAGPPRWSPPPPARASTSASSTTTPSASPPTRPPPGRTSTPWSPPSACRRRTGTPLDADAADALPAELRRTTPYLTHPVFHDHRSETAMLRYLRRLADRDLALDRTMIPLGSCTMKLNATTEMEPVTWPEFGGLHPFAAADSPRLPAAHRRPRALAVRDHRLRRGEPAAQRRLPGRARRAARHPGATTGPTARRDRDVCLIPASAHGTNAASAVMAGMRVVVVAPRRPATSTSTTCTPRSPQHGDRLAALMVTYPSTHGVFEDTDRRRLRRGARRRRPGLRRRRQPQRARRPGPAGPVRRRRQPPQPAQDVLHPARRRRPRASARSRCARTSRRTCRTTRSTPAAGPATGPGPISAAPYGSAGILPIPWAYVRLMGGDGLTRATQVAVLSANYVAPAAAPHYPVLYTGRGGLVAHECIVDLRADHQGDRASPSTTSPSG